jgi:hypothetical protein
MASLPAFATLMIAVARRRPRPEPEPTHRIVASGRERDLSRRVTARLVCRCGHVVQGEPLEASRLMAAHMTEHE